MSASDILEARFSEVRTYLDFLARVEIASSVLINRRGRPSPFEIGDQTRKILKAAHFIVLYNVVEATLVNGIKLIHSDIHRTAVNYTAINEPVKRMWVREKVWDKFSSHAHPERHIDSLINLFAHVGNGSPITLSETRFISGNVDSRYVREICDRFGIRLRVPRTCRGGVDLDTVVARRNALAHGDESFSDVGKDYSVSQLREMSLKSRMFIRSVTKAIDQYCLRSGYR